MLLNCGFGEDSWESLGLQGDPTSPSWRRSILNIHWKDWCWSWNYNTLATCCKEWTHFKRPWCWEILKSGGEGDDRGWDGCMASPTEWGWVWASFRSWWWTGKPGMHGVTKSQTWLNVWTKLKWYAWRTMSIILYRKPCWERSMVLQCWEGFWGAAMFTRLLRGLSVES